MSEAGEKKGWLARLGAGLSKSSSKLTEGIGAIFTRRKLDDDALEELEDLLITADLGPAAAARLAEALRKARFGKDVTDEEVRGVLAEAIAEELAPVAKPLEIDPAPQPFVILVVGVNGTGKTTTIGKLGKQLSEAGHKVLLAAGDTFRAAAIEQLGIWAERIGAPLLARETGADAAALAYEAVEQARMQGRDVVLIDTAGRLHTKHNLMEELRKIVRVVKKLDGAAPHSVLLVLDATTGQNAHRQVEQFRAVVEITGLIVTKLDGSAKGGVLVGLAEAFAVPVHAIGVGETAEDLRPFEARSFARSLMGLSVE